MPDNYTELFVAIGRIEEGVRHMRESIDRVERKVILQDNRLKDLELDVQDLKTQNKSKSNGVAVWLSVSAIVVAAIAVISQNI
jgi:predicted metallo-beta-lactamase superfamily hydrolase